MTSQEATQHINAQLRKRFGTLLVLREVTVLRRAAGRVWRGRVVCPMKAGDLAVGFIGLDVQGRVVEDISVEDLAAAFKASEPITVQKQDLEEAAAPPFADMEAAVEDSASGVTVDGDSGWDLQLDTSFDDGLDDALAELERESPEEVWQQVERLLKEGTDDALRKARDKLPLLLVAPEERGVVLSQMAWVEMQLDERSLALDYLEAAAREFADSADLQSLELLCDKVVEIIGEQEFSTSLFNRFLRETRTRVEPIADMDGVPVLTGLEETLVDAVEEAADMIQVTAENPLLVEGEPSRAVFFVKSGRLGVKLETPDGDLRTIANLLPGDLVGESSVLSEEQAFCNATVQCEVDTVLWKIESDKMRRLFEVHPKLKERLGQARELRRIHSFLSLHPEVGELEAGVRASLLGCIDGIVKKKGGSLLVEAGQLPPAAYIVIKGAVEQRIQERAIRLYGPDDFLGFRDTLHGIASECELVVLDETTLVVFNPDRLRTLGLDSPPNVVAVLERLG